MKSILFTLLVINALQKIDTDINIYIYIYSFKFCAEHRLWAGIIGTVTRNCFSQLQLVRAHHEVNKRRKEIFVYNCTANLFSRFILTEAR